MAVGYFTQTSKTKGSLHVTVPTVYIPAYHAGPGRVFPVRRMRSTRERVSKTKANGP